MSADTGAGVDDLFDKQAKTAEKLNKETANNAKKLEQHYKKVEISSKIIADRQEKHLAMENKYMNQRRLMQTMQRSGAGGSGVMGNVMNMMQGIGGMKVNNYQRLQELNKKGLDMNSGDIKERNMLKGGGINSTLERLDKMFDNAFGGDSKWNKMFGGHGKMAAMGVGAGAVGSGLAVSKAIIDSSAMLQQMFKLMQFGFMLILKPIGDFFGFLMRPILILLLRKFIIPFYQKVYPWFATTGAKIGTDIAKVLDYVSDEGVIAMGITGILGAVAGTLKIKDWFDDTKMTKLANKIGDRIEKGTKLPTPDKPVVPATDKPNTTQPKNKASIQFQQQQFAGNGNKTTGNANFNKNIQTPSIKNETKVDKVIKRLSATFAKSPLKALQQLPNLIGQFGKTNIGNALQNVKLQGSGGLLRGLGGILSGAGGGQALPAILAPYLDNIPFMKEFKKQFTQGMWDATGGQGIDGSGLDQWIQDNIPQIGAANGFNGMIKKPTMFLVGEQGSEHVQVTPHGQQSGGGTTVNITIGNMSGDANDLNKLRSTILEVMQTVNVNRGR